MPQQPPDDLAAGPLTLAAARRRGITDHQWRHASLLRHTRTVRSREQLAALDERAAAFLAALPPDVVLSHVTAARLLELPLPWELQRDDVLDCMRSTERGVVRRRGCRGHRGLERRRVMSWKGFRLTSVADTWVDLGERPEMMLDDLVVAGDAAATLMRSLTPPEPVRPGQFGDRRALDRRVIARLEQTLVSRVRPRGGRRLTLALGLVRVGARSPMETRTRLLLLRRGFPAPEVCADLHAEGGGWLAEGDLVWRAARVVAEYQGAQHASIRRRGADAARRASLEDEDWTVLEVFADDLDVPARRHRFLTRLAHALALDPASLDLS
ncbi:MAG: hypothetical protein ACRCY9_17580 [Phycicoccus sp.]